MKFSSFGHFTAGALVLTLVVALAGESKAACANFPDVSWWGNISHERISRYVQRKHDGDWIPYIAKWERQLAKVKDVYDRDSRIVIRKRGITLQGDALGDYITKIVERIDVTRCLAGNFLKRSRSS